MLRVFFGDEGIADRPLDADRGIVPQDAAFLLRTVEITALVEELNSFGQRQESVCKSGRNEQLILLFRGKIHARPLSEVWRAHPDVHGDIQRLALNHAAQFGLRMGPLIMESPQRPLYGTGVVILDEVVRDAKLCELGLVVSFHEKTARVAENIGEELPDSRERCVQSLQRGNGLGGSALRSGDPFPGVTLSDYPIHRIMHSKYRRDKPQKLNSVGLSNQTGARKRYAPADCSTGPNKRDGAQPWDNPSWGSEESGGRSAPNRNSRFGPLARASQCFFYP